jgi:hypothetical protein
MKSCWSFVAGFNSRRNCLPALKAQPCNTFTVSKLGHCIRKCSYCHLQPARLHKWNRLRCRSFALKWISSINTQSERWKPSHRCFAALFKHSPDHTHSGFWHSEFWTWNCCRAHAAVNRKAASQINGKSPSTKHHADDSQHSGQQDQVVKLLLDMRSQVST